MTSLKRLSTVLISIASLSALPGCGSTAELIWLKVGSAVSAGSGGAKISVESNMASDDGRINVSRYSYFTMKVSMLTASDVVDTAYTGTLTFQEVGSAAGFHFPTDTTLAAADLGSKTFQIKSPFSPGSYTVRISEPGGAVHDVIVNVVSSTGY